MNPDECMRGFTPLLLDHFQEIAMINNTLKNGPQSQTIMTAESRGEADDGYFMRESRKLEFWIGVLDIRVEV